MTDDAPIAYTWDLSASGPAGVSCVRGNAATELMRALSAAEPGTEGILREVRVSGYGVDYIPIRVVGRAERSESGVVWTQQPSELGSAVASAGPGRAAHSTEGRDLDDS